MMAVPTFGAAKLHRHRRLHLLSDPDWPRKLVKCGNMHPHKESAGTFTVLNERASASRWLTQDDSTRD